MQPGLGYEHGVPEELLDVSLHVQGLRCADGEHEGLLRGLSDRWHSRLVLISGRTCRAEGKWSLNTLVVKGKSLIRISC